MKDIIRMKQLAGLITEGQANEMMNSLKKEKKELKEEKSPDIVLDGNGVDWLDDYVDEVNTILEDNDIMAKCKAGYDEVEIYLIDKSERAKAIEVLEDVLGFEIK